MRLWPVTFFEFLPDSQLLAQKREVDFIWKDIANSKKTNHILINYIWEYDNYIENLSMYYYKLEEEFKKRKYSFRFSSNMPAIYFYDKDFIPFKHHHDRLYELCCFYNLTEKYMRGQKDFWPSRYNALSKYIKGE
jgi:hypothetical protein